MLRRRRNEQLYELLEEETFVHNDDVGDAPDGDEPLFGQRRTPRRAGARLFALAAILVALGAVFAAARPRHGGDATAPVTAASVPHAPVARRGLRVSASRGASQRR